MQKYKLFGLAPPIWVAQYIYSIDIQRIIKCESKRCQSQEIGSAIRQSYYNFSPYARSPASPSPGTIYECSFNSGSIAAAQMVVFESGKWEAT